MRALRGSRARGRRLSRPSGSRLGWPALWATAASGATIPEVLISGLKNGVGEGCAGGSVNARLYETQLTDVRISAVQATAGATDSPETVTLLPHAVTLAGRPSSTRSPASKESVSRSPAPFQ